MAIAGLAACKHEASRARSGAVVAADAAAAPRDPTAVRIPDETRELVTVVVSDWDATAARVRVWTRPDSGAAWSASDAGWPAVIGRTGAAWGRGLHGDGAPGGRGGPIKHEGDGKSPAGMFAVGRTFGYAASAPSGARVSYQAVDGEWRCVDDPASSHYTQILDERTVDGDWSSAEVMKRDDELYTWVVEIRHNADAARGGGSCIFFHVWSGPASTTVGCTAMAERDLVRLISALDPAARPVVVLLPAGDYDALRERWQLPALDR